MIQITPFTTLADVRPVLKLSNHTKLIASGVWWCFNECCPVRDVAEQRVALYLVGKDGVVFKRRLCETCGVSMTFQTFLLELEYLARVHISRFYDGELIKLMSTIPSSAVTADLEL